MGTIKALCISEKKGTLKTPIHKALFQTEWGMVGDAHAGRWHRQVSFLGLAEIEEFRKRGIDVKLGAFGVVGYEPVPVFFHVGSVYHEHIFFRLKVINQHIVHDAASGDVGERGRRFHPRQLGRTDEVMHLRRVR